MRGYVGGKHAGVSAGIPGPTAYLSFLGAIVWLLGIALIVVLYALAFLLRALPYIVRYPLKWITAPIWWPLRCAIRRRRNVADRKAVARVQKRNLVTAPQSSLPPPNGIPRFGGPPRGLGDR